jgi:NitT/TauT family transport system permease protein
MAQQQDIELKRIEPGALLSVPATGARAGARPSPWRVAWGAAATATWLAAAAVTQWWPNHNVLLGYTRTVMLITVGVAAAIALATLAGTRVRAVGDWIRWAGPWLVVSGIWIAGWQLLTAKTGTLAPPYWAPPQAFVSTFHEDGSLLADSTWHSLRLLAIGYSIGASLGFLMGVAMGWSQRVNYWLHPILRTIGPIPPAALVPIFFVVLPSITSASILLVAMAAWFPVTMLTYSGVSVVSRSYYDVALTLGARPRFLVWRVAVPAALPSVFVGLFMGLGMTFITLVVAEMLGAKNGLGWYIQWQQRWSAYPKMYTAILVMIVLFSSLITLLFRARGKVLSWQKELVRW